MLYLYNSLTKQKEKFNPLVEGQIKIYVCGPTVYDYFHIGNARVFIFFDTLVRYLRACNYQVTYVRNITDIDDKILHRAQVLGEDYKTVTARFIKALHEDETALNNLPPDLEPCATTHIPAMIEKIAELIKNGYAYVTPTGDVYFDISKFPTYGKLTHQDLKNLRAGIRVEVSEEKKDPLDFALWKNAKPDEPSWQAPWGNGRPGWHIECSIMSLLHLGDYFDIHGGGHDLKFPHHENEIAQSEALLGKPNVGYWMHVGFVEVNKTKMSKSLGNFFTVREVLKQYSAEVIRYFLLSSHYRSPLNYSEENLQMAQDALTRLYTALKDLPLTAAPNYQNEKIKAYQTRFYDALDDDLNTPLALAVLFDLAREINRHKDANQMQEASELATTLRALAKIFGVLQHESHQFLQHGAAGDDSEMIEQLIQKRNLARQTKNWSEADRIRAQLTAMNIEIEDGATGTTWKRK